METVHTNVLVLGCGTAGSSAARAAAKAGALKVIVVHPEELINTCIEEGCMPSKSILAGAHTHLPLTQILEERDAHILRLKKALTESFKNEDFEVVIGVASFIDDTTVAVIDGNSSTTYTADSIIIATGSQPMVPSIPGLDTLGDRLLISDDVVAKKSHFAKAPERILTIGSGPIGLELSTFFHDLGSKVTVLQRSTALGLFDPEFGTERVRASLDSLSFPICLNSSLTQTELTEDGVVCTIEKDGVLSKEIYDAVLVATGRTPNLDSLQLENTTIKMDNPAKIHHDNSMHTTASSIYIAGDVTGHHQILHFAAEMGKVAGHNAANTGERVLMDYDKHMIAVSFDQFPSALIGLTETEAKKRGIEVITSTKEFKSIGLGILKRQEYGMWKVVADAKTGKILGSQILGPDSSGELIQLLVPIIANGNTFQDVLDMTWYHPTYAEIIKSIARDLANKPQSLKAGM